MNSIKRFLEKKFNILSFSILFLLIAGVSFVSAYMMAEDRALNKLGVGTVDAQIVEEFNPPQELEAGISFTKDVKVQNTGTSDCYVRLMVLFSDSDIEQYCSVDWNDTDWVKESDGYWYYKMDGGILTEGELTSSLMTTVTVSEDLPSEVNKDFDIIVYTECYQAANYDNYTEAWADFEKNHP